MAHTDIQTEKTVSDSQGSPKLPRKLQTVKTDEDCHDIQTWNLSKSLHRQLFKDQILPKSA